MSEIDIDCFACFYGTFAPDALFYTFWRVRDGDFDEIVTFFV